MRRILAAAGMLVVLGCGSDGTSSPSQLDVTGAWNARTVNGATLPAVLVAGPPKLELLDDTYTFNGDHTYSEVGHFRVTNGSTVTTSSGAELGSYVQSGSTVTLTVASSTSSNPGAVYSLSFSGGSMTNIVTSGLAVIYGR